MTAENLRQFIVEYERPTCKGEPGPHAIANHLSAMQWDIFEAESPKTQKNILKVFAYKDIEKLRSDTTELLRLLVNELGGIDEWRRYFRRREDHVPFLKNV